MASVVFQLGCFSIGGVERVTVVLANELVKRGHVVCISALKYEDRTLLDLASPEIEIVELSQDWLGPKSCAALSEVIQRRNVDVVINQWCVPFKVTRFLRKAMKGSAAKLFAVHHNLPTTNKRIQDAKNPLIRFVWKVITAINLRLVYEFSDRYVLLSESFVPLFKRFAGLIRGKKVAVITNPLTLDIVKREKENLIVYVGRLEETQKRVSRVIDIWREVSKDLPDWKLEIVGDGPDRAMYERMAKDLPRITFEGFQDPAEYYARAKLLLLTSDFEGFALVLVEAMCSRCVPIVLGSYPAAYDIVRGGVVEPMSFDLEKFVSTVKKLATDEQLLTHSADVAETASDDYSVNAITDLWEKLFKEVRDEY